MVTFEQLNVQNDKITQLSNVLVQLIPDHSMCDNPVTAELFFRYVDHVKAHLDVGDRHLYASLLTHRDQSIKHTASLFLSGSGEIKRVFEEYLHRWCNNDELRIRNHDSFVKETEDMFRLVLRRIEDETEHLYPLLREVRSNAQVAA
jgi:hemerythrin-like domain-containing protein